MSARDYDMGRVDERMAVDRLLASVEETLASRANLNETLFILARVQDYRSNTERCLRHARAAGWYT